MVDTMFKLVNNPDDIGAFAPELLAELQRNAEEIATPEVRQKVEEAINTVRVTQGEYLALLVDCSPSEVEAVLLEVLGTAADEVSSWIAQLTAPIFASARVRSLAMVEPYLRASLPPAEATAAAEKFLRAAAAKFGAEEEEAVEEDHDDLEVLCDCDFSRKQARRTPTRRCKPHLLTFTPPHILTPAPLPATPAPARAATGRGRRLLMHLPTAFRHARLRLPVASPHHAFRTLSAVAYGNRVLLHNTHLKLKRGKCYGLIGPNGAGKSTLMRSIAADLVEGFPKEIRSVYVECDVSATHAEVRTVTA